MSEQPPATELSSGSIWRRWDPHVHLPGTLLNDQFGSMTVEQALNDLAGCAPRIEAAGITDYFTTASFRNALAAHEAGAGEGIRFLFPNVELRLDVQVASGSGVNIHLLSAPEDVDWLDQFVARLEFTYGDQQYRADGPGLVALGRAFLRQPTLDAEAAKREGAQQFKVSFAQLREEYRKDGSAPERLLVAVAGDREMEPQVYGQQKAASLLPGARSSALRRSFSAGVTNSANSGSGEEPIRSSGSSRFTAA